jgi:RNA polymerase sigma-70 factor (ECF subfamily)
MMTDQQQEFVQQVYKAQGILFRICNVYARDAEKRNDLRQEMLLQLWRSYPSFRKDSAFSTWMYRVALNTALMQSRKEKRESRSLPIDDVPASEVPREEHEDDEGVRLLYECIQELPALDRAIVLLHLEERTGEEIADIIGVSRGNVGVRLVRLKERLRRALEAKGIRKEALP